MAKKTHVPLPEPLRYLQPFVRALEKLPPEELNEDIDASRLHSALRKRIRGMDEETAAQELEKDRELLEDWLKNSALTDHPAYWVLGCLLLPDLAAHLTRPSEPPPRGPVISFEPSEGWKVKVVPFRLDLKKGKLLAVVGAIDEFSFHSSVSGFEFTTSRSSSLLQPPGWIGSDEAFDVKFGEVTGKKFVSKQIAPFFDKRVDYFLVVPCGFVNVWLGSRGVDFDEKLFESKFHTLRLSEPVVHSE